MLKKIVCFILVLCTLVSLLAVPVLAAEDAELAIDRSADIARGEELGFGDFIDVETYANNAGMPGYDKLTALRIDTPQVVKSQNPDGSDHYLWTIPIYIYNPFSVSFYSNCYDGDAFISLEGRAYVKDFDDKTVEVYDLGLFVPNDERDQWMGANEIDDMFFVAYIRGTVRDDLQSLSEDDLTYYVESIEISGFKDSDYTSFDINIDQTMQLSGIDYKIDVTKPDYDLSAFFDVEQKDIAVQYPVDKDGEISLAYLYEREYGTEDYSLYLYLYNPVGAKLVSLGYSNHGKPVYASAKMSFGSTVEDQYFTLVSSSDTLVKLKSIGEVNMPYGREIRDYYISDINIRVRDNNENTAYKIDCEAHYEYSNSPLTDVEKLQFEYAYRISDITLGKSFDDGDYEFYIFADTDKDYSLYISENGNLVPASGLVWNGERSCYYASSSIEGSSISELIDDYGNLKTIFLKYNSDFPGISAPKFSITVYKFSTAINDGHLDEKKIVLDMVGFSPIGRSTPEVSLQLLSGNIGMSSTKYARSDIREEISIKCDSTFYRINSSSSGIAYQKTLSSVGFPLNASYFNMSDVDVKNDSYLDYINFTYGESYLKPAFVTTDENFVKNNAFITKSPYGGYHIDDGFIATNYEKFETTPGDILVTETYADIWFGNYDADAFDKYFIDKHYSVIPFVFVVDHEGEFEDFEYVLTSEEIEAEIDKYYRLNDAFDGEIIPVDKTITFKEKTELLSYRDATFDEVCDSLGFFTALWHRWFGMDDTVMESIGNINCIEMILPDEYLKISTMSDQAFSDTYLVALNEAAYIKQQVLDALSKNQVYTFLRFDTYDYYAADATISGLEHNGDAFIFQEKYYKDFDIIELGISNEQETVVYNVKMDSIDILAGATTPDVIIKDDVTTPGEHIKKEFDGWWNDFLLNLEKFGKIAAIVAGAVAVILLAYGCVRVVIYVRNARTLNKVRKQINSADKHRKRKRK